MKVNAPPLPPVDIGYKRCATPGCKTQISDNGSPDICPNCQIVRNRPAIGPLSDNEVLENTLREMLGEGPMFPSAPSGIKALLEYVEKRVDAINWLFDYQVERATGLGAAALVANDKQSWGSAMKAFNDLHEDVKEAVKELANDLGEIIVPLLNRASPVIRQEFVVKCLSVEKDFSTKMNEAFSAARP